LKPSLSLSLSLSIVALLASGRAHATTITSQSCTVQADNSMRFDCTINLSNSDTVRVGRRPQTGGPWKWSLWRTGDPVTIVLYNFDPDVDYEYKWEISSGGGTGAINLTGGPDLPTDLDDLDLDVTRNTGALTNYVMFDTMDCTGTLEYLVAVDTTGGHVAWYQDIEAAASLADARITGWSWTADNTLLTIVNRSYLYEWALDGSETATPIDLSPTCSKGAGDQGECPHHDAFRSDDNGKTYVATGTMDLSLLPSDTTDFDYYPCNTLDGFVDDGVRVYASGFGSSADHSLMVDMGFAPDVDGGPNPVCPADSTYWEEFGFDASYDVIDWTHVNSTTAIDIGGNERVRLSLREWDQIVNYDPDTRTVDWVLNGTDPARSDFALAMDAGVSGHPDFGGQHHVTHVPGGLLMFDNREHADAGTTARAIQIDLDLMGWDATIVKSWALRETGSQDPIDCTFLGSAVLVPGSGGEHVLANCGPETLIQELGESDGELTVDPLLEISLDRSSAGGWDYCDGGGGPATRGHFYRAWPLAQLGEF
jgi:hypothetical protein